MATTKKKTATKDPCWEGYEKIGMKMKNGKLVPNCIPKKAKKKNLKARTIYWYLLLRSKRIFLSASDNILLSCISKWRLKAPMAAAESLTS